MRGLLATVFASTFAATAIAAPTVATPGKKKASTPAPSGAKKLSPDEIKAAFFDGKTFTASTPAGIKYKMTFSPDGKMTRMPEGKAGEKGEGAWSLNKDGFCTSWKNAKQNCYRLFATGENQWAVSNGSSTLATWNK
jgi:hypothetical protein